MAKATPSMAVQISKGWQVAFIATVAGSYIAQMGFILYTYLHNIGYISKGTWAYQITQWVYPILYVGLGFVFVRKRQKIWLNRLFWALLIGVIGVVGYEALQFLINIIHYDIFPPQSNSTSWWSAFGWDWSFMAAGFVMYASTLAVVAKKSRT